MTLCPHNNQIEHCAYCRAIDLEYRGQKMADALAALFRCEMDIEIHNNKETHLIEAARKALREWEEK